MISRIDRKRIFIFVAITYGITIALGLVIFSSPRALAQQPPGPAKMFSPVFRER